ncbi:spindly like TPR repeats protein [Cryptosporidium ryanae]|uniref:spindly like TPR repeats protein n=1 Tax=Cryptosporidium ryanae TaxID=515981 RepID=UPI00351A6FB5|nr:spindly like TPR repeats protein [Cryptosporidium ryanae]
MKDSLCFCDYKDSAKYNVPGSDVLTSLIDSREIINKEISNSKIILLCLASIEIVKDVNELMDIYSELIGLYCCEKCVDNSNKVAKLMDLNIKNDSLFLGKTLVKMIFIYNELNSIKNNKLVFLLLEIVKHYIFTKQLEFESKESYSKLNDLNSESKHNLIEYISLIISFVMIQILLENYDYSFNILDYVGKKYPSVELLLKSLRRSVHEIPNKNSLHEGSKGSGDSEAHKYYSKAFPYYPHIINCFVRSILSLHGVNLNCSPNESILIKSDEKSNSKVKLKDEDIYKQCISILRNCHESGGVCTNLELEYSLLRLYFEIEDDIDTSIEMMERIVDKSPFNDNYRIYYAKLLCNKALLISQNDNLVHAKSLLKKAITYIPNSPDIYNDLAIIYNELGKRNKAIWCFELSINLDPVNVNTYNNFGIFLRKIGHLKESILCYEKIININPKCVNSLNIIASLYNTTGKVDLALEYFKKCIQLDSGNSDVFNNLGVLYRDIGNFVMAKNCFLIAIQLNKENILAYQNLVYISNYFIPVNINSIKNKFKQYSNESIVNGEFCLKICEDPKFSVVSENHGNNPSLSSNTNWLYNSEYYVHFEDVIDISLEWGDYFTQLYKKAKENLDNTIPIAKVPNIDENNDSPCEIRLGFVGAEFFHHAVGFFIHSPLKYISQVNLMNSENSSNIKFDVYIYDNSPHHDYLSDSFKKFVKPDNWKNISGKDAVSVSKLVREDGVHVLFDLSGHTVNNSLGVFALKSSPIQISWIGYPNTTGLKHIDYRITDSISDPTNTRQKYSERLIYLPKSFLCFSVPQTEYPNVGDLPFNRNGYITFGSFNRLTKLHPITIDLWGHVLKRVNNSRLVLKSKAFTSAKCKSFYLNLFSGKYGIEKERLIFLPLSDTYYSHLDLYNNIDISLDTFPYSGTTTTFECIFMGVPLITFCLDDNTNPNVIQKNHTNSEFSTELVSFHSQNVGKSILYNLNLVELIAHSKDQFVNAAADLSSNTTKLNFLRSNLRNILVNSDLCDGERFSRDFSNLMIEVIKKYNLNQCLK